MAGKQRPEMAIARQVSWCGLGCVLVVWLVLLIVLISMESGSLTVKRQILPLRQEVKPAACEPQEEDAWSLVHIDCPIRKTGTFRLPAAFSANLPHGFSGVFLEMKVEMYQSTFQGGFLRSQIQGVWSDHIVSGNGSPSSSSSGWSWSGGGEHRNPDYFPYVEGAGRKFADRLLGGYYEIEKSHIVNFHSKRKLKLVDDKVYHPSPIRPPTRVTSENTQVYDNVLYTGDPSRPQIGDLRITFYGSAATHLSAIGIQSSEAAVSPIVAWVQRPIAKKLLPFPNPLSLSNQTILIIREGDHSPTALLNSFEKENDYCAQYLTGIRLAMLVVTTFLVWGITRARRVNSIEQRPAWVSIFSSTCSGIGTIFLFTGLFNLGISILSGIFQIAAAIVFVGIAYVTDQHGKIKTGARQSVRTTAGYSPVPTTTTAGSPSTAHNSPSRAQYVAI